MYPILFGSELGLIVLLIFLSWIAGSKASNILYKPSAEAVYRKARKQLNWAGWLTLFLVAILGVIGYMIVSLDFIFWEDRAFVHAPLLILNLLAIFAFSIPKLIQLRKLTTPKDNVPKELTTEIYAIAAHPKMVIPFQATALSAVTIFYYGMSSPVPFKWDDVLPLVMLAIVTVALWYRQSFRYQAVIKPGAVVRNRPWIRFSGSLTMFLVVTAALALIFYTSMERSKLPGQLSMMSGTPDYGGGIELAHDHGQHAGHAQPASAPAKTVSVTDLTGPKSGIPDRKFTLTAEKKTVQLASGKSVDAWTFNGQIPGPELRMNEGELIEVTLINKDVEAGATIHWHGLDVPNAEDGVAGVTQDSVMPGGTHTYRFIAGQVGTFWYHSHQVSEEAVQKGLFGPLIVEPKSGVDPKQTDITVITHIWNGAFANGSNDGIDKRTVQPGTPVKLRLINTDDWVREKFQLIGTPFKVTAIDGTSLTGPGKLENTDLVLTTGGRYDVEFTMPDHPVYLSINGTSKLGVFLSPDGNGEIPKVTPGTSTFNPSEYGSIAPTPFNASSKFDREFTMVLDNRLGFYNGQFDQVYTINGELFPNTPMFMVRENELIKTTIINRSMVDHPMHLHGHHMLVLSHNGKPVQGTWWSDTLDVVQGDVYEVAFKADNPGMWMDHCHNLQHAGVGMSMHLMYEGVTSTFSVGEDTNNHPE